MISHEREFIQSYLDKLSTRPAVYGPKLPAADPSSCRNLETPFDIVIKILKPPSKFTIASMSLTDTVAELKDKIHEQKPDLAVSQQRLVCKGKVLADAKTLADYPISADSEIHLSVRSS